MRDREANVYICIDRYLFSTTPKDQLSELFKHQALVKRHIIAGCLSVRSEQQNMGCSRSKDQAVHGQVGHWHISC